MMKSIMEVWLATKTCKENEVKAWLVINYIDLT